jgi:hypothetical protein
MAALLFLFMKIFTYELSDICWNDHPISLHPFYSPNDVFNIVKPGSSLWLVLYKSIVSSFV